jgi:LCP family protein required for cell wall assembly
LDNPHQGRAAWSAGLSFVLPGLGHLASGRTRTGILLATPVVGGLLLLTVAWAMDLLRLRVLLDPTVLASLLALSMAMLAWRVASVLSAYRLHASPSASGLGTVALVGLILAIGVTQWVPAHYLLRLSGALERVSQQAGDADDSLLGPAATGLPEIEGEGAVPADPGQPPAPTPAPVPTPAVPPGAPGPDDPDAARLDERVTVLLLGTDDLEGRDQRLTDTIMVVSLGAADRRPLMVSVPRDLYGAPLPDGRVYNARLNSLASYARARPDEFPGGGAQTLRQTVELLLEIGIDYVATIDMHGLVALVDDLGGVEVNVVEAIDDPVYPATDGRPRGFRLDPGLHEMDGATALAYARSRHGPGSDDFDRARRQQRLLAAIRARVDDIGLTRALPTVFDAIDDDLRTDVPRDRMGGFAEAVLDARWDEVQRLVLSPPRHVTPFIGPDGGYYLRPDLEAIRSDVAALVRPSD